uniref:Uncharacterized protein n=1 Tax=viral metagenome TaxID=1070528 RepID=A0A6C0APP7_9ZZZZ
MSSDDKSVFDKMEDATVDLVTNIRQHNAEYVLAGLLIGLHKPSMGWIIIGLTSALPTIIILKHSEWIQRLKDERIEHVILFLLLLLSSDIYALSCFGKAIGFN